MDEDGSYDEGYDDAIREVINLLESEQRVEWDKAARRLVCAEVVAQKLGMLAAVLRKRIE